VYKNDILIKPLKVMVLNAQFN